VLPIWPPPPNGLWLLLLGPIPGPIFPDAFPSLQDDSTMPDTASILIVDDEEPIRRLLTRILTDAGYTPLEADTGDQALTMLGSNTIQLILLDLHMPGQVDGEELLFQLRDQGDEIPIIVVSGWVDDETIANQPDCVHAVLKKPIQREHLLKTIDLALNK
jgi:two-component system KDP operon response regulator KdpE